MRALVTGGAGFIGSNLVDALLGDGAEVAVLDDLSSGTADNLPPAAELHEGSVADADAVAAAVQGCDVVFHLAASRAVLQSVEQPLETDRNNVGGSLNVLVASRDAGVSRVVSASSSSVYGGAEALPTPESTPTVPRSPYAVSKLAAEHYARVFWELFDLETVSLRFFNVYGPRQRPESRYAAVIPLWIDALKRGEPPEVHGDGKQSRDFTFISDVVAALLLASSVDAGRCAGEVYNVAGGRRYSLLQMLDILEKLLDSRPGRTHTDPRAGDIRHSQADITRARADLDFEPRIDLQQGLELTVDWFS